MERHKFWILLGAALLLGFGLEVLKAPRGASAKIAGFGQAAELLEEGGAVYQPDSQEEFAAPVDKLPHEKKADRPAVGLAPVEAPKVDAKKVDPKNDQKNKKDEKKKDDKKKKKKKKKKKTPTLGEQLNPPTAPQDEKDKKKEASAMGAASSFGANAIPLVGGGFATDTDDLPKTEKEWEEYLLAGPSMERTEKFIKAYQTGKITVAVFYQLVTAMLEASDPEIKKLGILALGGTPSVRSFEYLVSVDHNSQFPSKAKSQVKLFMRVYSRLENLKILISVVTKNERDNATPAYEAIVLMRAAADAYLGTRVPSSINPTTQSSSQVGTLSLQTATKYFGPVLAALKTAQTWPDKSVSQAAAQTYAAITTYLPAVPLTSPAPGSGTIITQSI